MSFKSINILKGTLVVPFGLALILIPYSLLAGWTLVTFVLFWLIITPVLTVFLPQLFSKNKNHLLESLLGMSVFYGFMVFMIYHHYQSDYFQLMIFSCLINLITVALLHWLRTPASQVQ